MVTIAGTAEAENPACADKARLERSLCADKTRHVYGALEHVVLLGTMGLDAVEKLERGIYAT